LPVSSLALGVLYCAGRRLSASRTDRVGDAAPYVEENQRINMLNARITNLGIRFCETIKAYATPCSSSEQ